MHISLSASYVPFIALAISADLITLTQSRLLFTDAFPNLETKLKLSNCVKICRSLLAKVFLDPLGAGTILICSPLQYFSNSALVTETTHDKSVYSSKFNILLL